MIISNMYKFYLNGEWRESFLGEIIEILFLYLYEVIG